jgi:hypothetical protein
VAAVNVAGTGVVSAPSNAVTPTGVTQPPVELPPYEPTSNPGRILDTRTGGATVDGLFAGGGVLPAEGEIALTVAGRGGVPATAASVVLNITAVDAQAAGYLTVYPCGEPRPNASNLNFAAGQTIPNAVISKIGTAGRVCLYTSAAIHVLADVAGFFPSATAFQPLTAPARALDTRPGGATADGAFAGGGVVPADGEIELPVAGRNGVPISAASLVLNITAVDAQAAGYVTAYPCGEPRPNASNLNFTAGQTIPNAVISKVGAGGAICLYTSAPIHLLVDVAGFFPSATAFQPLPAPARALDTRPGGATADGAFAGGGVVPAGGEIELPIAGRVGIDANAASVVLNVTAVDAQAGGYATIYPCGGARPNASNLNFTAGQTIPNAVIARIGAAGKICLYTSAPTHLLVDVAGTLASG